MTSVQLPIFHSKPLQSEFQLPPAPESCETDRSVLQHWLDYAGRAEVDSFFNELFEYIRDHTRRHRPICLASGACCHFESHGHRLYVTGLETAWTLQQIDHSLTAEEVDTSLRDGVCPFLNGRLCGVHLFRPMGCRVYFCDRSAKAWQSDLYEHCHNRIRELHESLAITYHYAEWRNLLRAFTTQPRS